MNISGVVCSVYFETALVRNNHFQDNPGLLDDGRLFCDLGGTNTHSP